MNLVSSISSPPPPDGVNLPDILPEVWGADLALRIWMWLSQMCLASLFVDLGIPEVKGLGLVHWKQEDWSGLQLHHVSRPPNRHARRMIARRARGIMPASRYRSFGAAGPLRAGQSPAQMRDWVQRRGTKTRFQSVNWRFYVKAFFRRAALWLSRKSKAASPIEHHCPAPLSPD